MKECEALKRQLADKDAQIARLRAAAGSTEGGGSLLGAGGGRSLGTGALGGWSSVQRRG